MCAASTASANRPSTAGASNGSAADMPARSAGRRASAASQFGMMGAKQAKRLNELEEENVRLKRIVAEGRCSQRRGVSRASTAHGARPRWRSCCATRAGRSARSCWPPYVARWGCGYPSASPGGAGGGGNTSMFPTVATHREGMPGDDSLPTIFRKTEHQSACEFHPPRQFVRRRSSDCTSGITGNISPWPIEEYCHNQCPV